MKLIDFFNEDNIFINFKSKDKIDFFQKINAYLLEKGLVKATFLKAILEREKEFPTGLNLGCFNVAIPHCDPIHITVENIIIVVPSEKIYFRDMGLNENDLPVDLIFLLLIKRGENQASILEKLMEIFLEDEAIKEIINCQSEKQILNKIREKFN